MSPIAGRNSTVSVERHRMSEDKLKLESLLGLPAEERLKLDENLD